MLIREQHPGINWVQLGAELSLLRGVHLQRLAVLYELGLNRRRRVGPRALDRKLYIINALQLDDPRLNDEQFMARLSPFLRPNIRGIKCRTRYYIARFSEFKYCLRPSVSFKKQADLRGHKGVGATFLAYGFSFLKLQSKQASSALAAVLRQGRQWAEDTSNTVPRPKFEIADLAFLSSQMRKVAHVSKLSSDSRPAPADEDQEQRAESTEK